MLVKPILILDITFSTEKQGESMKVVKLFTKEVYDYQDMTIIELNRSVDKFKEDYMLGRINSKEPLEEAIKLFTTVSNKMGREESSTIITHLQILLNNIKMLERA